PTRDWSSDVWCSELGQSARAAFVARVGVRTDGSGTQLDPGKDGVRIGGIDFRHAVAAKGGHIKAVAIGFEDDGGGLRQSIGLVTDRKSAWRERVEVV